MFDFPTPRAQMANALTQAIGEVMQALLAPNDNTYKLISNHILFADGQEARNPLYIIGYIV
jgi:hypothetical protein